MYSGRRGLKLVQEKFKITDNNKLALPPLLNSARLRHLHVPLVRGPDAAGWVDTCNKNIEIWGCIDDGYKLFVDIMKGEKLPSI